LIIATRKIDEAFLTLSLAIPVPFSRMELKIQKNEIVFNKLRGRI